MHQNLLSAILLVVVSISLFGSASPSAKIRYANSMPQFGKATVKSIPPFSTLFSGVIGGALTPYINFTTLLAVLVTEYPTNVTALSFPYFIDFTKYYSLYTCQIQSRHLANVLVEDRTTSLTPTKAALRTINLLQYNFYIDVFNVSNNLEILSNVSYGVATNYISVPPGDYSLYWQSSSAKKRDTEQFTSNRTGDPFLFAGFAYTHWVLPTGSFIVRDGYVAPTRKRSISASSIRDKRIAKENQDKVQEVKMTSEVSLDKQSTTKQKVAMNSR